MNVRGKVVAITGAARGLGQEFARSLAAAGARVIAQTIREKLPEGLQRAEYLLAHGMLDMVVPRQELRATLSRLTHILMKKPRPKSRPLPPPGGNGRAVAAE